MSTIYIAQGLDSILKTWEDFNLTREAGFHYKRFMGSILESDFFEPLIGSEINKYGTLARAIPNYKLLRKVLDGSSFIHPTNFLPRVPKDQRMKFSSFEEYCEYNYVLPSVLIPSFLFNWLETKRALVVEDTVPIPLVDLRTENWLANIPYHSFYLRINSPIVFSFKSPPTFDEKEWSIRDFLVYENGDLINILVWATENDHIHLSPKEQEEIEKITKRLKQVKFKKVKEFTEIQEKLEQSTKILGHFLNFGIKKGTSMVKLFDPETFLPQYIDLYKFISDFSSQAFEFASLDSDSDFFGNNPETWKQMLVKTKVVIELLNGFCKLVTHLPKGKNVLSIESTPVSPLPKQIKKWYELNAQTVNYLETESNGDLVIIKRSTGAEKSPHIRRAHFRRIVQSNGTIKEVWITETIIRKDKLDSEQLQGGALRIS